MSEACVEDGDSWGDFAAGAGAGGATGPSKEDIRHWKPFATCLATFRGIVGFIDVSGPHRDASPREHAMPPAFIKPFTTEHRVDTSVDISSVRFWSQSFDERDRSFAQLRENAPISWHPALETPGYPKSKHREAGFWAVTTVADISQVSRNHELFSSSLGQVNLRPAPFALQPNMLVMDPPLHSVYRRVVSSAFTPKAVARMEQTVRRRSKQIVARAAALGEFDFVRSIAAQLPLRTIADLLGLPASEHDRFVVAGDAYVGSGFPQELPPGMTMEDFFNSQVEYLQQLCVALAAYRRAQPAEDLMTHLVNAEIDGRPLTDDEILSTMLLLVVAGDDTTKQATTLTMLAFDRNPDQREWLMADFDARIENALDEFVRYSSPILAFARTATRDTTLGSAEIAAGDKVAMFYCSGNRDEAVFDSPERFNLARPHSQHVAFGGGGVHFCLGSVVAKAQLAALFREIFTRIPNIELGEPEPLFSDFTNGVTFLPARVG
jgi:cytochrome P450